MDAGTGILPSVRNATGGVFHAERAWAADATSVKIGGVELNSSTPYYVNGQATNDANQNWTAKFENGTLTLNGLNLNLEANKDIQGIVATGDLTIKLIGTNSITQNGTRNAIRAGFALTISGAGTLTVRDSANSPNSLIYAEGKIEIKEGAVIDAAKTGGRAQTINAHGGNLTVTGSNTSVKAVNHGSVENSDAIRVDLNGGSGNGTVTISDGATLEAETAADDAVAINAWLLKVSSGQDYIARKGESLAEVNKEITMTPETSPSAYSKAVYGEFKEKAVKVLGPNYLTFTAQAAGSTICFDWHSAEAGSVQTSTDGGKTWYPYTKGTKITLAIVGDKVSFKGKNVITSAYEKERFQMTGRIAASGSVTSLTDGKGNDPNVMIGDQCYYSMFWKCDSLTTAPELPAVKLAKKCYMYMFYNCKNLETAPELPATDLAESCYGNMFDSCTSLTTAPELPATTLKPSCYDSMFENCKSLRNMPELKAVKMEHSCYRGMFLNCNSLQTAGELPATELAEYCYAGMFTTCSKLQQAPALPVTELKRGCYYQMFMNCSKLTETPTLPAESLAASCYKEMFSGCKGLTTVPELPATKLEKECYESMFSGCTGISIKDKLDAENGYTVAWSIPSSGKATFGESATEGSYAWNTNMFAGCSTVDFGSNSKMPQANVADGATYVYYQKGSTSGGETHTHTTPTQWTTSETEHWYVCSECNQEIEGSRVAHSTAAEANKATCQKAATCDVCGRTYGEKAAHVADTTKWVYDAAQHWRTCIYGCNTIVGEKVNHTFSSDGKCSVCRYTKGSTVNPTPNPTPSGSSGGGYVAPSTDVKTSGNADSKVTSSPSTVQNETRTDASGKQETVAKVTVSAANQREILSQAKANKSKRIIIQIAKTAVQGDAKLELNLDKTFVQSILHDTEASLTIRTADGDRVISREALKTLVAQTEGNTVVIDPAAQENPTDPAEPSKAETLAALDSSRLVARSKLVTLKNGRKGIRITWSDRNGAEMNFDSVEIYRSTKKNRFGKKPFYATKGGKSAGYYINSKGIRSGVTYYYKVRGYVLVDGQKHYTDLSLKAIRTVK